MYYALIFLCAIIFGGCFGLNDAYRKNAGSGFYASMWFSLIGSAAGLVILMLINGFSFAITPFVLLISIISVINSFLFTYCSFKALGSINLSVYSLFSMLGGMLLPFLQGLIFFNEGFTVAKVVCLAFIFAALVLTVDKNQTDKNNKIYYAAVFVFNGLSGVISKIFASAPTELKTTAKGIEVSSAGFSMVVSFCSVIVSAVIILLLHKKHGKQFVLNKATVGISAAAGSLNRIANWILVLSLANGVPASMQYPIITGGTMIVSTVMCFFGKNKPKTKEIYSVVLAFLGLLAIFLIPLILEN